MAHTIEPTNSETNRKWFVSDDGALHNTSVKNWAARPLRKKYAWHCHTINHARELASSLRAGDYAWPGGYAIFYITSDGAALAPSTVRREFKQIAYSIKHKLRDGWRVVACDTTANSDEDVFDDHTGKEIV